MKRKATTPTETSKMRCKAEERLWDETPETAVSETTETNAQRLLHELQVHQIELEMQNEELRRTKDELEVMLIRSSNLHDFAPVGYVTLDCRGTILNVNFTCADLLGIERSLLVTGSFLRFISADSRPSFLAFLANIFESQASEPFEALLHTNDHLPLHARIAAVLTESKNECLVALIDITRSKLAEKDRDDYRLELQKNNESLEQRIDDNVKELRRMDKMLLVQNRQAAMGEMIGFIAHQWRQPLNILGIKIQTLALYYDKDHFNKELLDKFVRESMLTINQMSQTINDFGNFFMLGKNPITFEINRSVIDTVSLVRDSLKFDQITMSINTQGDLFINGYPNEYSQVLLNIIMNARDALLEHKVEQPCITISSFMENDRAVITIADNGGGIPDEILDHIFEPYFTTKSPDKGTGIGLYMAKTIICKNMGGRLTVRNINGGAEFRIEV
jgi:signal transduction histidine kinase